MNVPQTASLVLGSLGILRIDHLAVTTDDLPRVVAEYLALPGARLVRGPGENVRQGVRFAFVQVNDGLSVEILAPLGSGDSPIGRHLAQGGGVYHLCYAVADLDQALLAAKKHGARIVAPPVPDIAFDQRRIVFLLHAKLGLLELVEADPIEIAASAGKPQPLPEAPPTNSQKADSATLDEIVCSLLPGMDTADLPDSGLDYTPGWDSLTQLRIIMAIESAFGISISSTALERLTTYRRLQDYLRGESGTSRIVAGGARPLQQPIAGRSSRQASRSPNRLLQANLLSALAPYYGKPVLTHCDVIRAAAFISRENLQVGEVLMAHTALLDSLPVKLFVCAFNYQFPKTRNIDLRSAPVQVGSLNQHMLEHWAGWRTTDPVFSWLTRAPEEAIDAAEGKTTVAFGGRSAFAAAVAGKGALLLYGTGVEILTLVHHAEWLAGGVPYRYNKLFAGTLVDWNGEHRSIDYLLHVRPWERYLDYDWAGIEQLLIDAGVIHHIVPAVPVCGFLLDAAGAVAALTEAIKYAPLCLLDAASREWVEPELSRLGRRFELADFESAAQREK
jgi:acyl carrier protein/aminoglycoside N3'-acetyltransferase/catechol 2,3-dioxygenase-like lactoylglutathione lyase family enzyme